MTGNAIKKIIQIAIPEDIPKSLLTVSANKMHAMIGATMTAIHFLCFFFVFSVMVVVSDVRKNA